MGRVHALDRPRAALPAPPADRRAPRGVDRAGHALGRRRARRRRACTRACGRPSRRSSTARGARARCSATRLRRRSSCAATPGSGRADRARRRDRARDRARRSPPRRLPRVADQPPRPRERPLDSARSHGSDAMVWPEGLRRCARSPEGRAPPSGGTGEESEALMSHRVTDVMVVEGHAVFRQRVGVLSGRLRRHRPGGGGRDASPRRGRTPRSARREVILVDAMIDGAGDFVSSVLDFTDTRVVALARKDQIERLATLVDDGAVAALVREDLTAERLGLSPARGRGRRDDDARGVPQRPCERSSRRQRPRAHVARAARAGARRRRAADARDRRGAALLRAHRQEGARRRRRQARRAQPLAGDRPRRAPGPRSSRRGYRSSAGPGSAAYALGQRCAIVLPTGGTVRASRSDVGADREAPHARR